MDSKKLEKLEYLFYRYSDGSISKEEMDALNSLILESESVQDKYLDFLKTEIALSHCMENNLLLGANLSQDEGSSDTSADSSYMEALEELAEAERTAAGVVVEKAPEEPDEKEAFLRSHHLRSRTGHWRRFFLKAACISLVSMSILLLDNLAMFLQTRFTPKPPPVVAQLIDQIDAEWDLAMQYPYDDGQMLQDTYRLTEGFVSIRFNTGAKITVEAPAEWSLQSGGNMELFQGRIYATVSEEARGFSVTAGNTKIVDRGTEFGVEVDKNENTQLHVIKGKTILFYGSKKGRKFEKYVNEGMAVLADRAGKVRNIALAKQKFARGIDSATGKIAGLPEDIPVKYIPIANSGFEMPDTTGMNDFELHNAAYGFDPVYAAEFATAIWTFTGGSGFAHPPSPWECYSISPDPLGDQFALMQGAASISQEMTGLTVGETYKMDFYEAARTWYEGNDLSVILDEGLDSEITIYYNGNVNNSMWQRRVADSFVATKESYTLTFKTTNPLGDDRATLIDGVRVMAIDPRY